ncbi:MAG: biopolymer transporter ExbD [Deltaproteobacteria bacterium]|nr:biopolymer transporter ExbD [Deltaproteobacteria bacterium]
MRYSRNRRNTATRPISDINVTPLVDVILVLLIIFMVTAPMLQMGIDVNLPRVKAKAVDVGEEKLILTINNKEEVFINKYKTDITGLKAKLESIFSSRIDREIFMRADKDVPYGFVVRIMSEVRKAGVDKLGMITESPKE